MHITKTNGIMLFREIIGNRTKHIKTLWGKMHFSYVISVFSEIDRILGSVPILVTRGITFICHLGSSPGNVLL